MKCTWDPNVLEREKEKKRKYLELAADLAKQEQGYGVEIFPIVLGTLGVVGQLIGVLKAARLWDAHQVKGLAASLQWETLCGAVRLIRRHMSA